MGFSLDVDLFVFTCEVGDRIYAVAVHKLQYSANTFFVELFPNVYPSRIGGCKCLFSEEAPEILPTGCEDVPMRMYLDALCSGVAINGG